MFYWLATKSAKGQGSPPSEYALVNQGKLEELLSVLLTGPSDDRRRRALVAAAGDKLLACTIAKLSLVDDKPKGEKGPSPRGDSEDNEAGNGTDDDSDDDDGQASSTNTQLAAPAADAQSAAQPATRPADTQLATPAAQAAALQPATPAAQLEAAGADAQLPAPASDAQPEAHASDVQLDAHAEIDEVDAPTQVAELAAPTSSAGLPAQPATRPAASQPAPPTATRPAANMESVLVPMLEMEPMLAPVPNPVLVTDGDKIQDLDESSSDSDSEDNRLGDSSDDDSDDDMSGPGQEPLVAVGGHVGVDKPEQLEAPTDKVEVAEVAADAQLDAPTADAEVDARVAGVEVAAQPAAPAAQPAAPQLDVYTADAELAAGTKVDAPATDAQPATPATDAQLEVPGADDTQLTTIPGAELEAPATGAEVAEVNAPVDNAEIAKVAEAAVDAQAAAQPATPNAQLESADADAQPDAPTTSAEDDALSAGAEVVAPGATQPARPATPADAQLAQPADAQLDAPSANAEVDAPVAGAKVAELATDSGRGTQSSNNNNANSDPSPRPVESGTSAAATSPSTVSQSEEQVSSAGSTAGSTERVADDVLEAWLAEHATTGEPVDDLRHESLVAQPDVSASPGGTAIQAPLDTAESTTNVGVSASTDDTMPPAMHLVNVSSSGEPESAPPAASNAHVSDAEECLDSINLLPDSDFGSDTEGPKSSADSDSGSDEPTVAVAALSGMSDREQGQIGDNVHLESTSATGLCRPSSSDGGPTEDRELDRAGDAVDISTGARSGSPTDTPASGDDNAQVNGASGDVSLSPGPSNFGCEGVTEFGSPAIAAQNEEQASSVEASGQVAEFALDAVLALPTSTTEQAPSDEAVDKMGKTAIAEAATEPKTLLAESSSSNGTAAQPEEQAFPADSSGSPDAPGPAATPKWRPTRRGCRGKRGRNKKGLVSTEDEPVDDLGQELKASDDCSMSRVEERLGGNQELPDDLQRIEAPDATLPRQVRSSIAAPTMPQVPGSTTHSSSQAGPSSERRSQSSGNRTPAAKSQQATDRPARSGLDQRGGGRQGRGDRQEAEPGRRPGGPSQRVPQNPGRGGSASGGWRSGQQRTVHHDLDEPGAAAFGSYNVRGRRANTVRGRGRGN
ncbi:hypothetical protein GGI18_001227 [Coemansia linderi]|uniref:Uncharacterized protein n=1 Tax=Coemansia linderi TaxID=2663919 RepID=A0ACC1KL21_9FUNG|nr:hypothetical protein GGI18_001227 [Coemansia linderi]